MPVVDTTQSFATGDTVTSTTLNNIMDQSIFVAGAVVSGSGLDITAGGQMTIADNGVPGSKITNGTITSSKIEDGTIVDADISASAAIAGSKLADNAITTAKITDASITAPKLNGAQTGTAPIFGVRAWVRFDGKKNSSGGSDILNTNRLILGSGNVSSVLKNATGDYTVTFTTPMPSANYVAAGQRAFETGDGVNVVLQGHGTVAPTANAFRFYVLNASATPANSSDIQVMVIG